MNELKKDVWDFEESKHNHDMVKKAVNGICPSCNTILSKLSYHGNIILGGIKACPKCGQWLEQNDDIE